MYPPVLTHGMEKPWQQQKPAFVHDRAARFGFRVFRTRLMMSCAIALVLLIGLPADAQLYTGSVTGVVTDPSKAVISGAQRRILTPRPSDSSFLWRDCLPIFPGPQLPMLRGTQTQCPRAPRPWIVLLDQPDRDIRLCLEDAIGIERFRT